tara:strand:+ start:284 stop:535 length:252 start_codon:yes stop_codon:yes gene_type:complete
MIVRFKTKSMKTVKEHLKKLPLQKRLQAMENIRKLSYSYSLSERMNSIRHETSTLSGSFIFEDTRQGHNYWSNINYKYYPYGN